MSIRLFISHSERDRELVLPLKLWLEQGLGLESSEVRCTVATNIGAGGFAVEALRKDIQAAEAVVGLITSNSLPSHWVQLEMGAGWLQDLLIPIRGPGVEMKDVPSPLSQFTMPSYCDQKGMREVLEDLSKLLGVTVNEEAHEEYENIVKSAEAKLALNMANWFSLPPVLSAYSRNPAEHALGLRLLCTDLNLQPEELFSCVTPKGRLTRDPDHLPEIARELWNVSKSAVNYMLDRPTRHFADSLNISPGILNEKLIADMKKALDSKWNHTKKVRKWFEEATSWIANNPPSKNRGQDLSGGH